MRPISASLAHAVAVWLLTSMTPVAAGPSEVQASGAKGLERVESRVEAQTIAASLRFEENHGQAAPSVEYVARGAGYSVSLLRTGAVLQIEPPSAPAVDPFGAWGRGHQQLRSLAIRMRLVGGNAAARAYPTDRLPGRVHYLIGRDPAAWHTDIATFARVRYEDVYASIDLVYYGAAQSQLEYDFVVRPGGDTASILMEIEGPDAVKIDARGNLVLELGDVRTVLEAPVAYQAAGSSRHSVAARYVLSSGKAERTGGVSVWRVGFSVGTYDRRRLLVIDPVVKYTSTPGSGFGYEVATDAAGHVYMTGFTTALQATAGSLQGSSPGGSRDAFVTKLDASGELIYSTYLGGSGADEGRSIVVDGLGQVIVTGFTASTDFPVAAAFQPGFAGGPNDAFVTKLNALGSGLVFSSYLGGNGGDFGHDVALDPTGPVHLTGVTTSPDFPRVGALQGFLNGVADAFIVVVGQAGGLLRSSFLGGSGCDGGWAIAVDPAGQAYVTGQTNSSNFPAVAAAQPAFGGNGSPACNGVFGGDAFVTKVDAGGTGIVYSTFLGGSQGEIGNGIAVDPTGRAVVAGRTDSADFPVVRALQPLYGGGLGGSLAGGDAFVARLAASGAGFDYVTFLGGGGGEAALDVGVDTDGQAYVAGFTFSKNFPEASAFQPANAGSRDVFLTKLDQDGATLLYSSYLGATQGDGAFGLAVARDRDAYVTGFLGGLGFVSRVSLRTLTLAVAGDGSGVVTSNPPGLVCGGDCVESFEAGQAVSMQAVPDPGSFFLGWSAPCSAGQVVLDGDTSCVATFARDSDGDGLPDSWELQFGLSPTSAIGDDGPSGDPDGDGQTNAEEYLAGGHPKGFATFSRRLAEGASTSFFATALAIANPSDSAPATVLVRLQRSDGVTASQVVTVGPLTRRSLTAAEVLGSAPGEFAVLIESDRLVLVDRTMRWDASGYGSHAEAGVSQTATTWYLAEGSTHSGFNLFYLIQNSGDASADVEITYLRPGGVSVIVRRYTVPPRRRFTVWVNAEGLEVPELASTDVSAVVRSTNGVPLVVERAMYLDTSGLTFGAGHEAAGITAPATSWFLAEGATGDFFDLFVLLANPGALAAEVDAQFLRPDGTTVVKSYSVPPTSRLNIWVDMEDPVLSDTPVSIALRSTNGVPFLAERAMWWPGPTAASWLEAHDSPGAISTGTRWGMAEGEVGGPFNTRTYVLVANTSLMAGVVKVTLLFEDGTTSERTFPLAPTSRLNVDVGAEFPEAAGRRFGTIVESLGVLPVELVVERAMYSDARGVAWAAGTSALATRLP